MKHTRTNTNRIVALCLLTALLQGSLETPRAQGVNAASNPQTPVPAGRAPLPQTLATNMPTTSAVLTPNVGTTNAVGTPGMTTSTNMTDPFANTPEMVRQATGTAPGMVGAAPGAELIGMKLRGVIVDDEGHAFALLEMKEGDVHVVREGDVLGLWSGGRNTKVKIESIHRQRVGIAFGNMTDTIIVR